MGGVNEAADLSIGFVVGSLLGTALVLAAIWTTLIGAVVALVG